MVAIKYYKKKELTFEHLEWALMEHKLIKNIDHPNILQCLGYFEDTDYVCIVTELMQSSISDYLCELTELLSEKEICKIFYKMTQAVYHCHENNIMHRDVKLDNFLINKVGPSEIDVKLADFGLAC